MENLTNQLEVPDLIAPDLRSLGSHTPSADPNLSSSSVENSHPKSIEALEKNQAKICKELDALSAKVQRNLTRVFAHQWEKLEELVMTQYNSANKGPAGASTLKIH